MQVSQSEPLTFEKVWAMFQESGQRIKEIERLQQETSQQMKDTDRRMKETDRKIGELGNRFGELAEHLVAPSIRDKFNALDYHFSQTSQNIEMKDPAGSQNTVEIDILLENGDTAIAVEVKSKPAQRDIDQHIKRMEALRLAADRRRDTRKFRGAIAGAIFPESVKRYTLAAGFYVIEQTGDTVKITAPEGFTPREW
ncbi:hypothetical protein AGMMS50293_23760 [Spirochaetia bacterium]|nr:hypothetical protein AGMMS50293_23760 [Spirochaetia bacterium]